jgi:N6-adenosine-specific RNA methylase IME4
MTDLFASDFPNKKYQIIYADPPWECSNQNIAPISYIKKSGSYHYNSMRLNDICNLPVSEITDVNALLFLWVRSPALDWGFRVGNAWGFKYATVGFVWDKQRILPSYYTPSQIELCLIFKKGKIPQPIGSTKEHQFLSEKRRRHSQKPDTIRDRITKMFPTQLKIELFARQKVGGWDAWGNEELRDTYIQDKLLERINS